MSVRRTASAYFALQGGAVILWWLLLLASKSFRAHFRMDEASEATLLAFWLPDLALLAVGSLLASYLCLRDDPRAPAALWFACGTISYATLYCFSFALLTDAAWLSVTLMLPAMLLSFCCALAVYDPAKKLFRQARPARPAWNLTKTTAQIIVFWGVLLFLVPYLITQLEHRLGIPEFDFLFRRWTAGVLFVLLSALSLWSGFTMTQRGAGTPLPLDSPRRLVLSGPYAFVRNPMAIAGLGQGLAVGLWLASPLVLGYVLIGGWIWQFLTRPLEEEDMLRHFGSAYETYRREVRCWLPRTTPYKERLIAEEMFRMKGF